MIDTYCIKEINTLALKPQVLNSIGHYSKEIDNGILQFCKIMADVIPKFFLSFPENIEDIQSILRNSIIADEIFRLLVLTRKELQKDKEEEYLQNLQSFTFQNNHSPIRKYLERENNLNYVSALENLIQITIAKSLGEMQDCVAWLSANISRSLYNPDRPDHEFGEDDKIEAFQYIIARSSAPDLPLYLDILNTFIDRSVLDFKDIGQDITRLYFALSCPSTKL